MARSRQSARKPKSKNKSKNKVKKQRSAQELLEAAEAAWHTQLDVETAASLYGQAAAQLRPQTSAVSAPLLIHTLEQLGEAHVSLNDPDAALENFKEALGILDQHPPEQQPSSSSPYVSELPEFKIAEMRASLYLYIGQLSMEDDALQAYQEGIKNLKICLGKVEEQLGRGGAKVDQDDDDDDDGNDVAMEGDEEDSVAPPSPENIKESLISRLSEAYCTLAELFLTDLCFHEHAEAECERYVQEALALETQDTVAPLQAAASLWLSQQRPDDAATYMLQAYQARLHVGCDALASLVGLGSEDGKKEGEIDQDEALELQNIDAVDALPDFEFRCQTAKILLECASGVTDVSKKSALLTAAVSVLGSLLAQNDEVVEVWYLIGCAFCAMEDGEAAAHYLNQAKVMLQTVQKGLKADATASGGDDPELMAELEDNASQMKDVETKLAEAGLMTESDTAADEMEE